MAEDKMVGWPHPLNGHEFEQALGDGKGQGSLVCWKPGHSQTRLSNKISHVKELIASLCMGRCKSLGSLKSFLSYAFQVSGASILCFHILSSSVLQLNSC